MQERGSGEKAKAVISGTFNQLARGKGACQSNVPRARADIPQLWVRSVVWKCQHTHKDWCYDTTYESHVCASDLFFFLHTKDLKQFTIR